MRASGVSPRCAPPRQSRTITAAAPSEIEDDDAAVTVPSLPNAGLRPEIFETSIENGVSSCSTS